jgi:hypothetical protein
MSMITDPFHEKIEHLQDQLWKLQSLISADLLGYLNTWRQDLKRQISGMEKEFEANNPIFIHNIGMLDMCEKSINFINREILFREKNDQNPK